MPDISGKNKVWFLFLIFKVVGVSRWINPLPDIALHTLQADDIIIDPPPEIEEDTLAEPTTEAILHSKQSNKRVSLNVGGVHHEVTWKLLEQYPNSRKVLKKMTDV